MSVKEDPAGYIGLFNEEIRILFESAAALVKDDPKLALFMLKTLAHQKKAVRTRGEWKEKGVHVPPFLIMSITGRCNLSCSGCYAKNWKKEPPGEEMSLLQIRAIFEQARDLGVSFILLAGGEPLLRREVLECATDFPEIVFPVFTNGLLIDAGTARFFKANKNLIPVISLEGEQVHTDLRRGSGTFQRLERTISSLRKKGVFIGTSLTFTRENYSVLSSDEYASILHGLGIRLFFFVEYVPVKKGTEHLVPLQEQRERMVRRTTELKQRFPGLFIEFPGEEERFGGCLSAGRGFAHINPFGHLEPCPFAPFHDCDLKDVSLEQGLNSVLLRSIRSNREMLKETSGGCALWRHQDWVRSLIRA